LINDSLPGGQWKIEKIIKLIKGRDNLIRSAEVTLSSRKCLHRAIKLLYPIECADDDYSVEDNSKTESSCRTLRTTRWAAIKARERLKDQLGGVLQMMQWIKYIYIEFWSINSLYY